MMNITILCSDVEHPIYSRLEEWRNRQKANHSVELVRRKSELLGGDILLLISCHEMISREDRLNYKSTLVIHASDLPRGKGWSPHIWQILDGSNEIIVSLIEAEDTIDSGAIWAQKRLILEGHELSNEINIKLFDLELELMDSAIDNFDEIQPKRQDDREGTYYRRRTQEDSRIDVYKTIEEQFNLLRVVDSKRYPAFFDFRGNRYIIRLEKDYNT